MTFGELRRPLLPAAAFLGGIGALALFLLIAGFAVGPALAALWNGAFGSEYAIASVTLVHAVPLIILGLAFALGIRAGMLNIGMEGQFAAGAIGAAWIGTHIGGTPAIVAVPLVLIAGTCAGMLWVLLPVVLRRRFGATEVISTLLLNFVATALVSYLVTGPLQEPSRVYPESAQIANSARLGPLISGTRLHGGFLIAIALTAVLSIVFARTRAGFALRAVGLGARAARIIGRVDVDGVMSAALLWSGALAGLGGAIEVSGVSYALYQNLSPGYGFTAIAVALLGRLEPPLVMLAGVLFGALDAGAAAMQRDAAIPAVAAQVVEAVVIMAMLLAARRETR